MHTKTLSGLNTRVLQSTLKELQRRERHSNETSVIRTGFAGISLCTRAGRNSQTHLVKNGWL